MNPVKITVTQVLPLPRSLLPFQSLKRSVPFIVFVVVLSLIMGPFFGGRFWEYPFVMLAGLFFSLPALRLLLPVSATLTGPARAEVLSHVTGTLERPSMFLGFRYVKTGDANEWKPVGPDLYPWDPSIRVATEEDAIHITGPAVILRSIEVRTKS